MPSLPGAPGSRFAGARAVPRAEARSPSRPRGYREKQRKERKQIATLVGIAFAFMYGLPLLMVVAYCLFSAVVAAVMIGIFAVAGAAQ